MRSLSISAAKLPATRWVSENSIATNQISREQSAMLTSHTVPENASTKFNRRQFIVKSSSALAVATAGLAAGCVTSATAARATLIGTQLYGWGQYYERDGKKMADHLDEILSAVRDCGYDYAESSLDYGRPENNEQFAARCRAKGLRPVSLYTGGRLHEEGKAPDTVARILAAAKVCTTQGFSIINCNPDPIGREKTDVELSTQVRALKQLGVGLNSLGMKLGIHHHTPEMKNRAREFHFNFENSDPSVVGFCYDVHWVFRGGLKPDAVLPIYGNRVVSWHLRQSRDGIWWEDVDKGDIDYAGVARFARRNGLPPLYTVELALEKGTKITRNVVENHQRSRAFVRTVFAG
ncbi:MAG: sugar phosphate isomerase/epimerase [Pedosphaera sp.]|nr:sugar phosphate isomerase/epimerase [Pedosphaera sp.]